MKTLRKLFFETKMTWPRVILFAVASAVVTDVFLLLPVFRDTSFENMGVTLEAWILFALIIIMNCDKPLEAGLKTFVFFLISQPLIYLIQVPFSYQGWGLFNYYRRWFIITLLTLPGGFLAWYVKKDNLLSAFILAAATGLLAIIAADFLSTCMRQFPKYLLSVIFIAAEIVVFILVLLKKNRNRVITAVITLAALALFIVSAGSPFGAKSAVEYYPLDTEHTWQVSYQDGYLGEASVSEDIEGTVMICADSYGTETVTLENELGETLVLEVTYSENGLVINEK